MKRDKRAAQRLEKAIRAGDLAKVRELIAAGVEVSAAFDDGATPIQLAAREQRIPIVRALAGGGASLKELEALSMAERLSLAVASSGDRLLDDDLLPLEELDEWAVQASLQVFTENLTTEVRADVAACEGELFRAVRTGDLGRLKVRIGAGDAIDPVAPATADTPLTLAIRHRELEMVEVLIGAGADVDHRGFCTPLAFALPDLRLTKRLLEAGARVHQRGLDVQTAFSRAVLRAGKPTCSGDSLLLVRCLLEAGAHPSEGDRIEGELLMDLERGEAWELFHELLPHYLDEVAGAELQELRFSFLDRERGAGLEDRGGEPRYAAGREDVAYRSQRALPGRAALGDLARVRELLAVPGVEIDGFDALRRTALMAAAEAGHQDVVRELIAAGADVDRCNGLAGSPRSTPLVCAAICPSAERDAVLRLLLKAGAGVDRRGADGRTALMHAVERDAGFFGRIGEPALSTRTLIDAGAGLDVRDPYGLTAWMRAWSLAAAIPLDEVAGQYEAIAVLLEEAGASTAGRRELDLIRAVTSEQVDEARRLLAAGADPDARRFDGATALMLAVRDGCREIVQLLIDAGCNVDARQWIDRGPRAIDAAAAKRDQATYQRLLAAGASPPDPVGRRRAEMPDPG
jgi:serine/threonine-protein phosphatase 6 regulatory ankyrin repeat subunit B